MLPYFQTQDEDMSKLQTTWASQLNPIISNPLLSGTLLTGISLNTGINVINHRLSRKQQGWILTDSTTSATVFRSAPLNSLTLELTASAPVTVSLWVF